MPAESSESIFLIWVAYRMVNVYHEDPNADFVLRLREMAKAKASERIEPPKHKYRESVPPGVCEYCGLPEALHDVPDPKLPHAFTPSEQTIESDLGVSKLTSSICTICKRSVNDPIHAQSNPAAPFQTQQFYAGGADVLRWLTEVAQKTQGSEVWRALFENTRTNLVVQAKEKGFTI